MSVLSSPPKREEIRLATLPRRWRYLAIAACICVLAAIYWREVQVSVQNIWWSNATLGKDFGLSYHAALTLRHGTDPLVSTLAWIRAYHSSEVPISVYLYAPTVTLLIMPLTFLPFRLALSLWGLAIMAALVGAIYAAHRAAGYRPTLLRLLLASVGMAITPIFLTDLRLGNINTFLLLLTCVALWLRQEGKVTWAGVLLGLACVVKPQWLGLAAFLLWKRERQFATITLATFGTLLLLPFLWLGGPAFMRLLAVWESYGAPYLAWTGNFAIKAVAARLFTANPYVHPLMVAPLIVNGIWLASVAVVVAVVAAAIPRDQLRPSVTSVLEVGIAISAVLLISPLFEYQYLVFLAIPLVAVTLFAARPDIWESRVRWLPPAMISVYLLLCLPVHLVEYHFLRYFSAPPPLSTIGVLLSPVYLYILIAAFALQLVALRVARTSALPFAGTLS